MSRQKKPTPAARARARRDPALATPPSRPVGSRTSAIRNLHLRVAGRAYPIGANVEGDTPWEVTIEGAATVTIAIRSPDSYRKTARASRSTTSSTSS